MNKRRIMYIIVIALFVFSLGALCFFQQERLITKKQLIRHFRSSGIRLGGKLRRELDSGSGIAANKKRRIKKAMDTLLNRQFDEAVTVFNIEVSPIGDKYGPFVVIYYVDENASLNQINYAESNEVNDVGDVLLPTEEFAPSNMRHVGICSLCLYLRLKGVFTDNAKPYGEFDEKYYLVVPSTLFNNIMEKKGQFILLDRSDNILDRVGLKELEQGPQEKLGAMGK